MNRKENKNNMRKYNRIGIFVGHSLLKSGIYTSAQGFKHEYLYNKQLGAELKDIFDSIGQPCDLIICPEYKFEKSSQERSYKLPIANSGKYDLIMELHLNCSDGEGYGTEVFCYPANSAIEVGQRIQNRLSTIFRDRKIKKTSGLYMLRETRPTAILIESFFCDSKRDCEIADRVGVQGIAKLIAEGVSDTTIELHKKGFEKGSYHKNVRITADVLNVRTGRGAENPIVVNHSDQRKVQFKQGQIVEIWYIDKAKDGSLWGSCSSGAYDANGKAITGFIHMGYTERVNA